MTFENNLRTPSRMRFQTFKDDRGLFSPFEVSGFLEVVQANLVFSLPNVVRGMHLQKGEHAQSKLLFVISGEILDAVQNPVTREVLTYPMASGDGLFVPAGWLHGYAALKASKVLYLVDNEYSPGAEAGAHPLKQGIEWRVKSPILSAKDASLPASMPDHLTT